MSVNILRCNKKIHGEAAPVLYGENCLFSFLQSYGELWHKQLSMKTRFSRCLYSRLVTMVHLCVFLFHPNERDPQNQREVELLEEDLQDSEKACGWLVLSDLKFLKISFVNKPRNGYSLYDYRLTALFRLRATRVSSPN